MSSKKNLHDISMISSTQNIRNFEGHVLQLRDVDSKSHTNSMTGEGKVERVAKAICDAAGKSVSKMRCVICHGGECQMWKTFRDEARAAIRAYERKD